MAIGHTRYSTTGDSALLNAQPISVESTKGLIAIAHNGNLVNLGTARERLERDGALFQTTSDSEIIIQLIAHSKQTTLVDCIADSLSQVEGAFSIVMMTRNRIFVAGVLVFLAAWQIGVMLYKVPSYLLPAPTEIAHTFVSEFPRLISLRAPCGEYADELT